MIALALMIALLQTRIGGDAVVAEVIEPATATETFVATCWRGLRDAGRFHAAVAAFAPISNRHGLERFRSAQAEFLYNDDDDSCSMTIRLATPDAANRLVETLTQSLGLGIPERGFVMDVGTEGFRWPQVPIDGRCYTLEAEADTDPAPGRAVDVRISARFWNPLGSPGR